MLSVLHLQSWLVQFAIKFVKKVGLGQNYPLNCFDIYQDNGPFSSLLLIFRYLLSTNPNYCLASTSLQKIKISHFYPLTEDSDANLDFSVALKHVVEMSNLCPEILCKACLQLKHEQFGTARLQSSFAVCLHSMDLFERYSSFTDSNLHKPRRQPLLR